MAAAIRQLTYSPARGRGAYDAGPAGPGLSDARSASTVSQVNAALAARMKLSSTTGSRSAARSSRRSSSSVHVGGFMSVARVPVLPRHARKHDSGIQEYLQRPAAARHRLARFQHGMKASGPETGGSLNDIELTDP